MSVFKRMLKDNGQSVDRPGVDEFSPPNVDDELWRIGASFVPMSTHGYGTPSFAGDLVAPVSASPPQVLPTDAPPPIIVTHYARARHGEGLWGVQPLIPEGETG